MRRTVWVFLLLAAFGGPAIAESDDGDDGGNSACLAAPDYACLAAGALAAAESERDRGKQAAWFAFLAAAQAHAGRDEDAAETLERAFACAPSIDGDWRREYFASLVIWAKAGMGQFAEASELAAHVETPYHSAVAWSALARGQALNGDIDGAARSLRMAEIAADQNKRRNVHYMKALLAVAFAYSGQPERAHEIAQSTRDMDEEKSRLIWTLYARAAAAVAEAIAGHDEDSATLIVEARAREAELEENGERARFLGYVSWAHAERGDRGAMLAAIRDIAAVGLDKASPGDKAIALAFAAMAVARAEP